MECYYLKFCSEKNVCYLMQGLITDEIHLGETVDPADNTQKVKSVNYLVDFNDIIDKVTNLQRLLNDRTVDKGF